MSVTNESETIIEDITALQNALSQPKESSSSPASPTTSISSNELHMVVYEDNSSDREDNADLRNIKLNRLLEINQQLSATLEDAKLHFEQLLEKCKERQEMVENKLVGRIRPNLPKYSYSWSIAMPYFKTKDAYYAPLNDDAKLKAARRELEIHHLPVTCRWTLADKNILLKAIRDEVKLKMKLDNEACEGRKVISEEVKRHIGALGEKEFDWMKIGTANFQNRHTAEECRVMWNVFLHPDINKTKWTKKEDAMLNILAKQNGYQDWESIAKRMETNRSGYQCFIRYNNNNVKNNMNTTTWTKEEDRRLRKVVEILKIGNFIPWSEVSTYFSDRTKQQIYYRWTYNVSPYLKKGRFTEQEDVVFQNAIDEYGPNFSRISTFIMPQRTTAQLNDHYNTLHARLSSEKNGRQLWEYEDDIKLLSLYEEYGNNWSRISKEFENKTRVQVRHRYSAIKKYENRGIAVEKIPRVTIVDTQETQDDVREILDLEIEVDDVDKEIINYFKGIGPDFQTSQVSGVAPRKFYTPQELTENVKKLYNTLQSLQLNIGRPNCLDQDRITEKDRQLFHVLSEFCKRSVNSNERERIVEYYRNRMFGEAAGMSSSPPYIPPLPLNCVSRSKGTKRNRSDESIDYVPPPFHLNNKIQLDYRFDLTPEHVLSEIENDEGDELFERLKRLLVKKDNMVQKKAKPAQKIIILSPEVLNKYTVKRYSNQVLVIDKSNNRGEWQDVPLNFSWHWLMELKPMDEEATFLYPITKPLKTLRRDGHEQLNFIKPNATLLACYQTILNYVQMLGKGEHIRGRFKVSYRGRVALELLKRRFQILFMYPICMSKFSIRSNTVVVDKIANSPFVDSPRRKRRRIEIPERRRKTKMQLDDALQQEETEEAVVEFQDVKLQFS